MCERPARALCLVRKDKHMLSEAERARALSAVAEGLGKDSMETYFSFRQQVRAPPPRSNVLRG